MMTKQTSKLTGIISWCLYDTASSSYSIIVTTFIFATYFTTKIAVNQVMGTYQWANAASLAGVIIALSSPIVGAIADHGGNHKRWLMAFTLLCIMTTGLLWFAYPNTAYIYFVLTCVVLGNIGYEVGQVFYNAFLPYLVPKRMIGRISGWGWGCGYLGGIIALAIALFVFVKPHYHWLDEQSATQIRICGPFAALWMLLFSLPLFFFTEDIPSAKHPLPQAIRTGLAELMSTLKKLPTEKNILFYLFAHMIYTDGLNTLFAFGGIYAAGTYGLSFSEVLLFGMTMNIAAGIGAMTLAWLDDYVGSKKTIIISLICLVALGIPLLLLHDKYWFWGAALFLCLFVGPVQAASRSFMVHLIAHKEMSAEMFGLYALSGRITAFIGPWLLGVMTLAFGTQRAGMAVVLVLLVIGGLLLLPVKLQGDQHG